MEYPMFVFSSTHSLKGWDVPDRRSRTLKRISPFGLGILHWTFSLNTNNSHRSEDYARGRQKCRGDVTQKSCGKSVEWIWQIGQRQSLFVGSVSFRA